jgi:hypothetical protein
MDDISMSVDFQNYLKRPASPRFSITAELANIVAEGAVDDDDDFDDFEVEHPAPCFIINGVKTYFNHNPRNEVLLANRGKKCEVITSNFCAIIILLQTTKEQFNFST